MAQDEFTKLFKYMEKRFDEMDKRFDGVDSEIRDLKFAVGELGGQIKEYHQEMVFLTHKVERLER